jgi:hypothetical protein
MNSTTYRQGDILFMRIETSVTEDCPDPCEEIQIAEGEVTGHHHTAKGKNLGMLFKSGGDIIDFLAPEGCRIEHDEHNTLELPPGRYRVRRQREYTYSEPQDVED